MQKITVTAEEKVGFPKYSNTTYGATLTRDIEDGADVPVELKKAWDEVEVFMATERANVQALLDQSSE